MKKNDKKPDYAGMIEFTPDPDFERLRRAANRKTNRIIPFFELYADAPNIRRLLGPQAMPEPLQTDLGENQSCFKEEVIKDIAEYQYRMGFDFTYAISGVSFTRTENHHTDTTKEQGRDFFSSDVITIKTRSDYEKYKWPDVHAIKKAAEGAVQNYREAKKYARPGMGVIGRIPGPFEEIIMLLGYEGIAYQMADDDALVSEIARRIGETLYRFTEIVCACPGVDGFWMGEDMGFKTSIMLPPAWMRAHIFPWHKKIARLCRDAGKLIILHSCGNLDLIYDDIIDSGFQAKHSFEDTIEPVWSVQKRIGSLIALFGGLDVDFITRKTREEVIERTKYILDSCACETGYAFGSGNSVADYINFENYITALNTARKWSH